MTIPKHCHDRRDDIAALILGELDPAAASQLNDHINDCQLCRGFRDSLADQENTLRSTFGEIARDVGRIEQLLERFDEPPGRYQAQAASPLRRLTGGLRTMRPSLRILVAAAAIVIAFTGLASWLMPNRSNVGVAFHDSPQDPDLGRQQFAFKVESKPANHDSLAENRGTYFLRVPSLRDQVADAEVIIVATLLDHTPVQTKHPPPAVEAAVQFRVTRVLKGDFPNEVITFREMLAPADEEVSKDWILLLSPQCVAGEYPNYSRMSIEAEPEILAILAGESVAP